ncbi:MAG TPA: ABC transporter ATP-binding protein [Phaeodactylibacter sp.]|nr:ABC transporter ATP-binding protein [Phaeodactylibacter sp.]
MINVQGLYLKYGDRTLFDGIDAVLRSTDRIGLVGRNGAGKSTFLKVLMGYVSPDAGKVEVSGGKSLGYLEQDLNFKSDQTVMQEALSAFADVRRMEEELKGVEAELARREDYESRDYQRLLERLSDLNERLHLMEGGSMESKAERVLKGLGFKREELHRPLNTFSGGWQMRVVLAKLLLTQPDFLLLDEPTNHLDIESIIWLEQFLKTYPGGVVVISHDKRFLDELTNRTLEIELGKIYDYKAPYSKYLELRKERREKMEAAYRNQQRLIEQRERTIKRFMAKATKTKMAQSMQKQLDKIERIELESEDTSAMRLNFPFSGRSARVVLAAKNLVKQYDQHRVLDGVDFELERGQKVAFVGQNGQGKTTLAKILVGALQPTSGEAIRGQQVQLAYYAQNQAEMLDPKLTVLETMEAASPPDMRPRLRGILGSFLFSGEDVDKKVSVLSGGERARLALALLMLRPFNVLVLDEPTNHLDIKAKEVLKEALQRFEGSLLVVSHDRDFLSGLTERTVEFRDKKLHTYLGDVNYFLEKRRMDDMRQVALSGQTQKEEKETKGQTAKAGESAPQAPQLSYEERKQLQRRVQQAERRIERIEKEKAKLENEMADPAFYQRPEAGQLLKTYGELKKQLDEAMEQWEEAQTKLDETMS